MKTFSNTTGFYRFMQTVFDLVRPEAGEYRRPAKQRLHNPDITEAGITGTPRRPLRSPVLWLIACAVALSGCRKAAHPVHEPVVQAATHYVCPMHPQVIRDKPGTCPICGMDLVPAASGALMLTPAQEQLANVRVRRANAAVLGGGPLINARLVTDEEGRSTVSSRAAGRIEKLFARETGRSISAGQPLYELYSETLNAAVQEYFILKDQFKKLGSQRGHYATLLRSAEKKLLRYGLTPTQIEHLTSASSTITFYSPASGALSEVLVSEGQYVDEGSPLFRLDKLNTLWVEAELYPAEAALFKVGDPVTVRVSAIPGPVRTHVSFLTPVYRENTQTVIMRASVDNRSGQLVSGMQATLQRDNRVSSRLQLPVDAVIRDARGAYIFIRSPEQTFSIRMVKTGAEDASHIEIVDGLAADEDVAVSGAYLLYSEWTLRNGQAGMGQAHQGETKTSPIR